VHAIKNKGGASFMSTNNYLKFLTEEIVRYFNHPKDERKKKRKDERQTKAFYMNRWFGLLPFSFRLFIKK